MIKVKKHRLSNLGLIYILSLLLILPLPSNILPCEHSKKYSHNGHGGLLKEYSDSTDSYSTDSYSYTSPEYSVVQAQEVSTSSVPLLSANFNANAEGFVYLDDTFRGTNNPGYANGIYSSTKGFSGTGGLQVTLGGVNSQTIVGISGGWSKDFVLNTNSLVKLTLRYRLLFSKNYEADECGQALVAIDGSLISPGPGDFLHQFCGATPNLGANQNSKWKQVSINVNLSAGAHTITIGGWNSNKNATNERTDIFFDDIVVTQASNVTIVKPTSYVVASLMVGDQYYVDTTHTLTSIPSELAGGEWIKTRNADKSNTSGVGFLAFNISKDSTVYVAYDSRATSLPKWLKDNFVSTGLSISVTDAAGTLDLYKANYAAGLVRLGGNLASPASGAGSNYIVIVKAGSSVSMHGITKKLPSYVAGSASVVYHTGNGRVYVSTNGSYLLELNASNLSILREKNLASDRAHQLSSDGTYLYVHVQGNGHQVLKIDPADPNLMIIDSTPSLNGSRSPEGLIFLNGVLYIAIGGPPGKIVKINPAAMDVLGTWSLPGGVENHSFTTDGVNLFVLGVPGRDTKKDEYYKVSQSLVLLDTLIFPWIGSLGGNVYYAPNDSVYCGGGKLSKINPDTMTVLDSASPSEHWLATDGKWIYRINYGDGLIRVVDPDTLDVVLIKDTGLGFLHYGIVQNGYLWVAHEESANTVGRYNLLP